MASPPPTFPTRTPSSNHLALPPTYSDHERYYITTGKNLHFTHFPTQTYRLSQTAESLKTKGTLWQLNPSASDDPATSNSIWDVYTNLPLYAARYDSPLVSGEDSRTVYWEFEITSLGYSTPEAAAGAVTSGGGLAAGLGIGLLVKDESSIQTRNNPNGSLRSFSSSNDEPKSLSGRSILFFSDGKVYENGTPLTTTTNTQPSTSESNTTIKTGDTMGIGITFSFDPSLPMVPTRDVHDNPSAKASKASQYFDRRGNQTVRIAETQDLQPCPAKVFITINGVEQEIGRDVARDFLTGERDIFPVLLVSGAGVAGKVRIGEAVAWGGEGGVEDAQKAAKGNAGKAGFKKSKFGKFFTVPGGGWLGGGGVGAG